MCRCVLRTSHNRVEAGPCRQTRDAALSKQTCWPCKHPHSETFQHLFTSVAFTSVITCHHVPLPSWLSSPTNCPEKPENARVSSRNVQPWLAFHARMPDNENAEFSQSTATDTVLHPSHEANEAKTTRAANEGHEQVTPSAQEPPRGEARLHTAREKPLEPRHSHER
jgi:hypothetical protein